MCCCFFFIYALCLPYTFFPTFFYFYYTKVTFDTNKVNIMPGMISKLIILNSLIRMYCRSALID